MTSPPRTGVCLIFALFWPSANSLPWRDVLYLLQQLLPALPGLIAGFFVRLVGIRRFTGAHEAVAGAFVNHRLEVLPAFFISSVDFGMVALIRLSLPP